MALSKTTRLPLSEVLEYITRNSKHRKKSPDIGLALHAALREGALIVTAQIPKNGSLRKIKIPKRFWRAIDKNQFADFCSNDGNYKPNRRLDDDWHVYQNAFCTTADLDALIGIGHNSKRKVNSVPEKVYKDRVEKAVSDSIVHSRDEDREWAKSNGYSVESVQDMRKIHAPETWQEKGRRSWQDVDNKTAN